MKDPLRSEQSVSSTAGLEQRRGPFISKEIEWVRDDERTRGFHDKTVQIKKGENSLGVFKMKVSDTGPNGEKKEGFVTVSIEPYDLESGFTAVNGMPLYPALIVPQPKWHEKPERVSEGAEAGAWVARYQYLHSATGELEVDADFAVPPVENMHPEEREGRWWWVPDNA